MHGVLAQVNITLIIPIYTSKCTVAKKNILDYINRSQEKNKYGNDHILLVSEYTASQDKSKIENTQTNEQKKMKQGKSSINSQKIQMFFLLLDSTFPHNKLNNIMDK